MDRFHKLFWECYAKNCEIEKEEPSKDDFEAIKRMDREKLYKKLRVFIGSLLEFKDKAKNSDLEDLAKKNIQFESLITKQEADIRSHIAKHYQLRLEIELQKNTIEELNYLLSTEKNENRELKYKIIQQNKIIDQIRSESKRDSAARRNNFLDYDLTSLNENAKTSRNSIKVIPDKPKPVQDYIPIKILSKSKSFKSRVGHSRCKSEISGSLKIIIPQ
jgi:hypothetical protein